MDEWSSIADTCTFNCLALMQHVPDRVASTYNRKQRNLTCSDVLRLRKVDEQKQRFELHDTQQDEGNKARRMVIREKGTTKRAKRQRERV